MKPRSHNLMFFAAALSLALLATPAIAGTHAKFLTGPTEGAPLDIAVGYLESNARELGLGIGDLADFTVSNQYVSGHNGVTHIYLQQRLGGIEVVNALINVNVMPDGRILNLGNHFVGNLPSKANAIAPSTQPLDALGSAAQHLGLRLANSPTVLETRGGASSEVLFDGAGISSEDIPARLVYFPQPSADGAVRLAWSLVIREFSGNNWWNIFVDAETNAVLEKFNWIVNDHGKAGFEPGRTRVSKSEEQEGVGCASNCYNVFATPKESPDDGPRTDEDNPADPTASPFGWHDTNGAAGAEFTDTRGNNAMAQTDLDANNSFGGADVRSEGGVNLIFDEPLDLADQPADYREFAVANLFYWNNIMHDITYQYGFDEAGGNFQENNYGNPGAASDPVQADAQDGAAPPTACNNANFGTPPDGSDPRMQMFEWYAVPNGRVTLNTGGAAGDYDAARGCWGASLAPPTTADLQVGLDGTPPAGDGCEPLVGFTPGNIALVDRGGCEFGDKGANAEAAGAAGVIVINDQQLPNGIISMGAGVMGPGVTIPAVMIGAADGVTVTGGLPANATLQDDPSLTPNRDSDLDAGVIAHEYGHGISNRLTGGPAMSGCLFGDEQAGEGWSDWWTLTLFPDPADTALTTRGVGNYLSFLPITGAGIRNFPYSTDLGVNPQTYGDIAGTNVPHGVGEIWAAMLWEVYWNLVERYGFDPDLYSGTGGNNLAIQLVIDGMKLQPCGPTFVSARDAILAADLANNAGANECEIWNGFAKRGLGFSAIAGGTGVGDEVEAFDLPPGIPAVCNTIFTDGFESGDTSVWSTTVP